MVEFRVEICSMNSYKEERQLSETACAPCPSDLIGHVKWLCSDIRSSAFPIH